MHKKLTFLFISVISVVLIIEIISRIFFSTFSKSFYPFYYGFNKNILIFVEDLSQLNFSVQNTNVKKINKINKINNKSNKSIWVFGGSTSAANCYNGSWPDELQNLLPEYEIINYSTGGGTTDSNLNILLKNKNKNLPEKILWANRHNEDFVLFFGNSRNEIFLSKSKKKYFKNRLIYFIKSIDLSFKKVSIFYFLFDDLIKRVNHKIYGPKDVKNLSYNNHDLNIAVKNYEINTEAAIKFAKQNNIEFYIVSLFGNYDFNKQTFFKKPLYPLLNKKILSLKKKWNINFIDTEENLKLDKGINYFCDNIHQTFEGNKLTAKIIFKHFVQK